MSERIVLLGTSTLARALVAEFARRGSAHPAVLGVISEAQGAELDGFGCPHLGTLADLRHILAEQRPGRIVVALEEQYEHLPADLLLEIQAGLNLVVENGVEVYERLTGKLAIELLPASTVLFSSEFRPSKATLSFARASSVLVACLGLVLCLPAIALIAALIRLESTGPVTVSGLAARLALPRDLVEIALARIEGEGQALRGNFTQGPEQEWCNRRVLARIHRLTLGRLRREIEPVSTADFLRFLSRWQHLARGTQLHGVDGLLQVIRQLQGYEISAAAWESEILPRRIARYAPEWLDRLCLSGEVMWGRLSPHPAFENSEPRRVRPTRAAPISLFLRQDAEWLSAARSDAAPALSHATGEILAALERRGASFFAELARATGRLPSEVEDGLWELVAAGLVTSDAFENLRSLVDPKRRRGEGRGRLARPRHAAGRWALMARDAAGGADKLKIVPQLLLRWGVVFRDLTAREPLSPPWREALVELRRMEARGEVRGGRFVSGYVGEQFATPEAVDLLRAVRRSAGGADEMISTADPLNLAGILLPGGRIHPLAGGEVSLLGASKLSAVSRQLSAGETGAPADR